MRIVFFGTTHFSATILRAVLEGIGGVLAVVTQPDRPAGRGRQMREAAVKKLALELGLPLHTPADPSSRDFVQLVRGFDADIFAVAAYGHIFGPSLLTAPTLGCVNVHASLLPKYRGAAPIHHALINGDTETGITTIWMDERMDAGYMILQRPIAIAPDDDVRSLERKLADLGAEVLVETLRLIDAGTAPRIKQDGAQATYAPAVSHTRAQIDWTMDAGRIVNLVRGTNPTPGAYTFHRGKRLNVLRALEKPAPEAGTAGEIVETQVDGLLVKAGTGAVLLAKIQPEGGRPMSAAEYARGHRPRQGEVLGAQPA